ncbi:alpha/beta fold hydrolase [Streptomyces sp. NPDC004327]|uniref:alpha/beta fold hydrolase n=1 Tax=Streptomyces sp. NPDC004327 TaxID=3364699 RepID=UPI00367E390A
MTLAHDVTGDGPSTVLLLHSGVCDRRMWDAQFDALAAAGHRVVRCDLRGFGDSPVDRPHLHADDVAGLLDGLGAERAALVGSSFGGEVALEHEARPAGVTEAQLAAVDVPVLAVTGGHDVPDFRTLADRLATLIPRTRRLDLDWAGHLPSLERPEEISALLADFLDRP